MSRIYRIDVEGEQHPIDHTVPAEETDKTAEIVALYLSDIGYTSARPIGDGVVEVTAADSPALGRYALDSQEKEIEVVPR